MEDERFIPMQFRAENTGMDGLGEISNPMDATVGVSFAMRWCPSER